MNYRKYKRQYFLPPVKCMDWAEKDYVEKAPVWCSVDLRDGNQALVIEESPEGQSFRYEGEEYRISLGGVYQKENAVLAIETFENAFGDWISNYRGTEERWAFSYKMEWTLYGSFPENLFLL